MFLMVRGRICEPQDRVTWALKNELTLLNRWSCDPIWCHGQLKMAAHSVEFWPSLERNFSGIGCTFEAKTTVSNST